MHAQWLMLASRRSGAHFKVNARQIRSPNHHADGVGIAPENRRFAAVLA
jgi:hypothetical protein